MLWGTSSLGLYVPWGGSSGPYLSVSLWLWLGVLDAIQGVGLGMILLQTLSRLHVCATLAFAQMIGSIVVIVARATSPNALGPGTVFPDAAKWTPSEGWAESPIAYPLFWVALVCQIVIVVGYFWFYRKEQLGEHSHLSFFLVVGSNLILSSTPIISASRYGLNFRTIIHMDFLSKSIYFSDARTRSHERTFSNRRRCLDKTQI
jgi:hypothetical protein